MIDSEEDGQHSDFCIVIGHASTKTDIVHAADPQTLQALNDKLSGEIRDMKGSLFDLRLENNQLIRVRKGERYAWTNEERRFKEIISDKDAVIEKLKSEMKRIEKSHSELLQQNNLLSTQYKESQERQNKELSESEVEIGKLKKKILSLEKEMKERDGHNEKVTTEVKIALQNQEEMMKKLTEDMKTLTEDKRKSKDQLDTIMNFITGNERAHQETMAEKDRLHKETMAAKDREHKEEMFEMSKKQFTSEQQKPCSERQPKQSSNETCRENKVQSNYFERRFRQEPNEPLGTNKETTEIQRLSWSESRVPIKRDEEGLTFMYETSESVPNGKTLASNVKTKQSPSPVTQSEQMYFVPEQQQTTRLGRDSQYNFPTIRRQRSFNWSTPNAPFKYPQSKKTKDKWHVLRTGDNQTVKYKKEPNL